MLLSIWCSKTDILFEKRDRIMSKATEDRRTKYSKRMIRESLFELMKEKPINKISVTEICKTADVNRSTFYSYYTDIYDLHEKIIGEFFSIQKDVIKHIKVSISDKSALNEFTYSDFYNIVYYYLNTVKENADLYKFIFNRNSSNTVHASFGKATYHTIREVLNPHIEENRAAELRKAFTFVAGGTTAFIMSWVGNDCSNPVEAEARDLARYYYSTFKAHSMDM